jgi:cobalt-zinc-cadmium efflux system protein
MQATHSHAHLNTISQHTGTRLVISLALTLAFVGVELVAGWWSNSLALLTDAAHNFTDVVALGLAWHAIQLAAKPAHSGRTFGYHRAGILIALVNATTLAVIALGIFYEAFHRFQSPLLVQTDILIVVAILAFVVNTGTAWLVRRGSENDLNLKSVYFHLMGDAASTFAAILAGIGIALTGWVWLDPLVSVFIGGFIIWNAWGIIRETVEILIEGTPRDLDIDAILRELERIDGVRGVHDLHVWSITQSMRSLAAHVDTDDISIGASAAIHREINSVLFHQFGIAHATLQFECAECEPALLYCDLEQANHRPVYAEARKGTQQ